MKKIRYLLSSLLAIYLSTTPFSSMASEKKHVSQPPRQTECDNETPAGGDDRQTACDGADLQLQDRILEETYNRIANTLPLKEAKLLKAAQRKWRIQQERKCLADVDHSSGSFGTLDAEIYAECLCDGATKRIQWLNRRYGNARR